MPTKYQVSYKEQLTFTSTVVFSLVLVPGSVQLTYKKYLVLTYLGKIYIKEGISQKKKW